jgi:hypothetical protein
LFATAFASSVSTTLDFPLVLSIVIPAFIFSLTILLSILASTPLTVTWPIPSLSWLGVITCCEVVGVTTFDSNSIGSTVISLINFPAEGVTVWLVVVDFTFLVSVSIALTVTFANSYPISAVTSWILVEGFTVLFWSGLSGSTFPSTPKMLTPSFYIKTLDILVYVRCNRINSNLW